MVMEEFERCGFVVRMNILDACGYGVPQRRKRVFIHGDRTDTGRIPSWPKYTNFEKKHIGNPKPISVAMMSGYMFPEHGYPKEQLKDLRYNKKMDFLVNRTTEADDFDRAVSVIMAETIVRSVEKNGKK